MTTPQPNAPRASSRSSSCSSSPAWPAPPPSPTSTTGPCATPRRDRLLVRLGQRRHHRTRPGRRRHRDPPPQAHPPARHLPDGRPDRRRGAVPRRPASPTPPPPWPAAGRRAARPGLPRPHQTRPVPRHQPQQTHVRTCSRTPAGRGHVPGPDARHLLPRGWPTCPDGRALLHLP